MLTGLSSPPQRQSHDTERRMKEELQQLRRCLQTEEDRRLAALKKEEAQKIRLIQVIRKTSLSLSEAVEEMEDLVEDSSFLKVRRRLEERWASREEGLTAAPRLLRTSSLPWRGSYLTCVSERGGWRSRRRPDGPAGGLSSRLVPTEIQNQ